MRFFFDILVMPHMGIFAVAFGLGDVVRENSNPAPKASYATTQKEPLVKSIRRKPAINHLTNPK